MILVVCALSPELRYVSPRAEVEVIASGVGPVEAALATARALALKSYDVVINAGIAGAFRDGARVGQAVIVATEWLAELGLEGGGDLVLPGGAALYACERADGELLRRTLALGLVVQSGVTVTAVTTTEATAERLRARYGAGVESMEGFSVLRAAAQAGVPALEVRGISNYVGPREASEWNFNAGAQAAARALDAILDVLL
jgi:futalosine hydrolase